MDAIRLLFLLCFRAGRHACGVSVAILEKDLAFFVMIGFVHNVGLVRPYALDNHAYTTNVLSG